MTDSNRGVMLDYTGPPPIVVTDAIHKLADACAVWPKDAVPMTPPYPANPTRLDADTLNSMHLCHAVMGTDTSNSVGFDVGIVVGIFGAFLCVMLWRFASGLYRMLRPHLLTWWTT